MASGAYTIVSTFHLDRQAADTIMFPETSVIIPSFNRAAYISRAVTSVLEQTYSDFEILVIDDGSTDHTQEALQTFIQNKQIGYFLRQNGGPAVARNFGIQQSRGMYLAFLDADDWWVPEKLSRSLAKLKSNPDAAMVFTNMQIHDENGNHLTTWFADKKYTAEGHIFEPLLIECFIITSTVVAKKTQVLHAGGFREDLTYGEDYALWLKMAKSHAIAKMDEQLTIYMNHPGNLNKNIPVKVRDSVYLGRYLLKTEISGVSKCTRQIFKTNLSRWVFDLGFHRFSRGDYVDARKLFRESLNLNKYLLLTWIYFFATFLPEGLIKIIQKYKRKFQIKLNF